MSDTIEVWRKGIMYERLQGAVAVLSRVRGTVPYSLLTEERSDALAKAVHALEAMARECLWKHGLGTKETS